MTPWGLAVGPLGRTTTPPDETETDHAPRRQDGRLLRHGAAPGPLRLALASEGREPARPLSGPLSADDERATFHVAKGFRLALAGGARVRLTNLVRRP